MEKDNQNDIDFKSFHEKNNKVKSGIDFNYATIKKSIITKDDEEDIITVSDENINDEKIKEIKNNRHILVIGKSGSGKSTICNAILDEHYESVERRQFKIKKGFKTGTTKTTCRKFEMTTKLNKYILKIIDAVGFFDNKIPNTETLTNIRELINNEMKMTLTNIFICIGYGRLTIEEKDAIKLLFKNF